MVDLESTGRSEIDLRSITAVTIIAIQRHSFLLLRMSVTADILDPHDEDELDLPRSWHRFWCHSSGDQLLARVLF